MKILGVIPSRYASTRFPAKPLADIAGKPMVQRVYEQAAKAKCFTKVVVATDHESIFMTVESFGGNVVMTSAEHPTGTDRCYQALQLQAEPFDFVINIQGDEPFIEPEQMNLLASALDEHTQLATLVSKINDYESLTNPNTVKVVFNHRYEALYFSRHAIPYVRGVNAEAWLQKHDFYKHIGIYAYRADALAKITHLVQSTLEVAESLEQLRWLQNGFTIKVKETPYASIGIDTPQDLEMALKTMNLGK